MAIDNEDKRRAAMGLTAPSPDSAISEQDRAQVTGFYRFDYDAPPAAAAYRSCGLLTRGVG